MTLHPLKLAQRIAAALGVLVVGGFAVAQGGWAALAAGVGAALALSNLWAIQRLASGAARAASQQSPSQATGLTVMLLGKMIGLFAAMYLAVRILALPVLPLGVGFFVLVPALLVAGSAFSRIEKQGAF